VRSGHRSAAKDTLHWNAIRPANKTSADSLLSNCWKYPFAPQMDLRRSVAKLRTPSVSSSGPGRGTYLQFDFCAQFSGRFQTPDLQIKTYKANKSDVFNEFVGFGLIHG
jgi:hypothetical protein